MGIVDVEEITAQKIDRGPRAYKKHIGPIEHVTLRAFSGGAEPDEPVRYRFGPKTKDCCIRHTRHVNSFITPTMGF